MRRVYEVLAVGLIMALAIFLTSCEKEKAVDKKPSALVFSDTAMQDKDWLDHQSPEKNELVALLDGQANSRHILDSIPTYGGIISARNLSFDKGKHYEMEFKVKVVRGDVTMQIIMDYGSMKPEYLNFGGIVDRDWTTKTFKVTTTKTSSNSKLNFTNGLPDKPAEFYIADVQVRPLLQKAY